MALTNKAKAYIKKQAKKETAAQIASVLKVEEELVQVYLNEINKPLSAKKKLLFYGVTLSFPLVFFILLELSLQAINYLGDTRLFVDPEIINQELLVPNPNFAARYFFYTNVIPNPSFDAFKQTKSENAYRVFAMGGSSAAGYPYGFNGTFSRVVKDVLEDALPQKEVEVVNVGISAISSYTLYDQVDEILEQKPDAIMIYAGHNEFYGALGVGSNENLGAFPGFVRFYLKLQRFKTFLFLRSIIVESGKWLSGLFTASDTAMTGTLMERIVDSRSIELGDPKFELAMIQFRSNISAIISEFNKAGVPVYISSVGSNLKDHPPFVDIQNGTQPSAQQTFEEATLNYQNGNYDQAFDQFTLAKDLDGLKFRAPSEINNIIQSVSADFENTTYVPAYENMLALSDHNIIGFNLMLEHLHPNQRGYFTIGKSFTEVLLNDLKTANMTDFQVYDWEPYFMQMEFTDMDHRIAHHRIRTLKQGFPFIRSNPPTPYQYSYQPVGVLDSLAFNIVHRKLSWDRAKVSLAEYYNQKGESAKAIAEYESLIRNQPWNDSPYVFAARIHLNNNNYRAARPLLNRAYQINKTDPFISKMLGAIELNNGNVQYAIELLEASFNLAPEDPQVLFNLSGAYGTNQEFKKALTYANKLKQLAPNFPGLQAWLQQLNQIIQSLEK